MGTVELRVPRVAPGTYFPTLLEPRRRAERALAAVIQEAYVKGISTRKVDDLVRALGMDGISRSEVSRICKELDREVDAFLNQPIEGEHRYVWLDVGWWHGARDGRAGVAERAGGSRCRAGSRSLTAARVRWAATQPWAAGPAGRSGRAAGCRPSRRAGASAGGPW